MDESTDRTAAPRAADASAPEVPARNARERVDDLCREMRADLQERLEPPADPVRRPGSNLIKGQGPPSAVPLVGALADWVRRQAVLLAEEIDGLRGGGAPAPDDRLDALAARVEALHREVADLRRVQEEDLAAALAGVLPPPEDPIEAPVPPPGPESVQQVREALEQALEAAGSEAAGPLAGRLESLRALERDLQREAEWQERAGELIRLLERRLLAAGRDGLAERQARFVLTEVPELLAAVRDLADRTPSPPARQALEDLAPRVARALDLEEIRPRRGDPYRTGEHNLLRALPADDPALENCVETCHAPGLRVRATGRLIRKADVSVFV